MAFDCEPPTTQKAWMVVNQGKPREALQFKTDVPVPKPKRGEVLVRVRAAALNPVGWKLMAVLPNIFSRRPHPAEHDLAGVIVDANGTSFSNGDEVIGFITVSLQFSSRQGALVQYVTLPEDNVTSKPTTLSWEESAGLPLACLTAITCLRLGGYDPACALDSVSTTSSSDSVFINGGSTSVGIYAIQLAKALSLHVTASASARNESLVRSVGADAFLDYTTRPVAEQLCNSPPGTPFSMVLDAAGLTDTALYARSDAYMKKGGVYVTTGPWPKREELLGTVGKWSCALLRPASMGGIRTSWKMVSVVNKKEDMELLRTMVERGLLRPVVDSTYEFGSVLEAYDRILTGRATGKVIVKIE